MKAIGLTRITLERFGLDHIGFEFHPFGTELPVHLL